MGLGIEQAEQYELVQEVPLRTWPLCCKLAGGSQVLGGK